MVKDVLVQQVLIDTLERDKLEKTPDENCNVMERNKIPILFFVAPSELCSH